MGKPAYAFCGFALEVAEAFGNEVASRLVEHCGGIRVDIPAFPDEDHWLSQLFDHETARAIGEFFAVGGKDDGERLTGVRHVVVPLGATALQANAKAIGLRMMRRGKSVYAIAIELGVHERTVWRWRAQFLKRGELTARDLGNPQKKKVLSAMGRAH